MVYYHSDRLAGQTKLLAHLHADTSVRENTALSAVMPGVHVLEIVRGEDRPILLGAVLVETREAWIRQLLAARGLTHFHPPPSAQDDETSLGLRMKISVASTLASSSVGRTLVKRYLDDAGRRLIQGILTFAEAESDKETAQALEKDIFGMAARIAVVCHAHRFPKDIDMTRLSDETNNFCHDFLMYSRDRRLARVRGAGADRQPLDSGELHRAIGEVCLLWRRILEPHVKPRSLERFDRVTSFFFSEARLTTILTVDAHLPTLTSIDAALREVLEQF